MKKKIYLTTLNFYKNIILCDLKILCKANSRLKINKYEGKMYYLLINNHYNMGFPMKAFFVLLDNFDDIVYAHWKSC